MKQEEIDQKVKDKLEYEIARVIKKYQNGNIRQNVIADMRRKEQQAKFAELTRRFIISPTTGNAQSFIGWLKENPAREQFWIHIIYMLLITGIYIISIRLTNFPWKEFEDKHLLYMLPFLMYFIFSSALSGFMLQSQTLNFAKSWNWLTQYISLGSIQLFLTLCTSFIFINNSPAPKLALILVVLSGFAGLVTGLSLANNT